MSEETRELRNGTLGGLLVFALTFGACAFVGCEKQPTQVLVDPAYEKRLREVEIEVYHARKIAANAQEKISALQDYRIRIQQDVSDLKERCARCHK